MVDGTKGINTRFSSTNQPQNAGRKPSRLKKFIKENDMSKKDVELIAREMLEMSRGELINLANDKTQPILISGFAAALINDMKKGYTNAISQLLERAVGKVTEEIDLNPGNNALVAIWQMSKEERKKRLEELESKKSSQSQKPKK